MLSTLIGSILGTFVLGCILVADQVAHRNVRAYRERFTDADISFCAPNISVRELSTKWLNIRHQWVRSELVITRDELLLFPVDRMVTPRALRIRRAAAEMNVLPTWTTLDLVLTRAPRLETSKVIVDAKGLDGREWTLTLALAPTDALRLALEMFRRPHSMASTDRSS